MLLGEVVDWQLHADHESSPLSSKGHTLPQSSPALLLVNVNEVAYHSSLKGAALSLHPYLQNVHWISNA